MFGKVKIFQKTPLYCKTPPVGVYQNPVAMGKWWIYIYLGSVRLCLKDTLKRVAEAAQMESAPRRHKWKGGTNI